MYVRVRSVRSVRECVRECERVWHGSYLGVHVEAVGPAVVVQVVAEGRDEDGELVLHGEHSRGRGGADELRGREGEGRGRRRGRGDETRWG